jgi:hypothetical protein
MNVNRPSEYQREIASSDDNEKLEQIRRDFAGRLFVSKSSPIPCARLSLGAINAKDSNTETANLEVSPPKKRTYSRGSQLFPKRTPAATSTAASPILERAKSFPFRLPATRSSGALGSESPVSPILERDEQLVGAMEILQNSALNFGCLDLSVPQDMSAREFSEKLLLDLKKFKEAVDQKLPLPRVQEKEVSENDIKSLRNFIGQILVNEDWTNLFHELIMRKDDEKHKSTFISPRVLQGLAQMQTQEDAQSIAKHLMSECTETKNLARVINLQALQLLLLDNRIKAFPGMMELVKDAAYQVMEEAIRNYQSSILFWAMRSTEQPSKAKCYVEKWEEKAKKYQNQYLDLDGINYIAAKCKFKSGIVPDKTNSKQNNLIELINLNNKIHEVLQMYNETEF